MITFININLRGSGLAAFRKEFNALDKDLKARNGKTYRYAIEASYPDGGGDFSQVVNEIPDTLMFGALKASHFDTKQIYSGKILGGGPLPQRVQAAKAYLKSRGPKKVIKNRREAQARFAAQNGILRLSKSSTGKQIDDLVVSRLSGQLKSLFK